MSAYLPRAVAEPLNTDMTAFPATVLTGARQTGKSTLARESELIASRAYVTLDDIGVLEQARRAPLDLLERHPEMTLDEVQREPELLLAIKALVDRDRPRRLGRFLLTGSANLLLMKTVADSLAGRAAYRVLHPMTRREQLGLGVTGSWSRLLDEPFERWRSRLSEDRVGPADWRDQALRGGLPVPATELPGERARSAWFEGYVRTYLERDLRDLAAVQSLTDFRRLMRAAAHRDGALLNHTELGRDLGMPQTTVRRYLSLLETSHLVTRLEPYAVNRTKRLIKTPKLYWTDSGLACHLAGVEPAGEHLENLVLSDLLAWAECHVSDRPQILYWRTASGMEVDFVIEAGDRVIGVEVKATRSPRLRDARHLRAFRDEYGEAVAGCLLLHTGEDLYRVEDRILATPWWRVM